MTPRSSATLERTAVTPPLTQPSLVQHEPMAFGESRHSIWLEVNGLSSVTAQLARDVGNPLFVPHFTVVANIPGDSAGVIEGARRMTDVLPPFCLTTAGFGTKLERFRYFCLTVTYDRRLEDVFSAFAYAFPDLIEDRFRAWPHVSLLYGTPLALRLCPFPLALAYRFGSSLYAAHDIKAVSVWDTTGDVADWQRIAQLPLQG